MAEARQVEIAVQSCRLGRERAVDIERPQCSPGPRKSARDRREVTPDQVHHRDPEDASDVGENLGDFAARGSFGYGRDRIAHH